MLDSNQKLTHVKIWNMTIFIPISNSSCLCRYKDNLYISHYKVSNIFFVSQTRYCYLILYSIHLYVALSKRLHSVSTTFSFNFHISYSFVSRIMVSLRLKSHLFKFPEQSLINIYSGCFPDQI